MSTSESENLGHLLRRYRLAAGLSQEALAGRSTVSVRAISDIERGQRMSAHLETVNLLAKGLGLSTPEHSLFLEAARPELHDDAEPALPGAHARPEAPRWARTLPVNPTPLIGREKVLAEILLLIGSNSERVITLTGPGGAGKTRLAIEAAKRASPSFDDGVAFVSLASVSGPDFVIPTIAQTLGIAVASASLQERLEAFLVNRHLLLVLDNFEHVVEAAPLIATLHASAPQVAIVVTSRVRLRLSAEIEYPVPALDLPTIGDSIEALQTNEAFRLFVDRATAHDSGFHVTAANAGSIGAICRQLDGLPLAIELAAARLNVLPAPVLLEWLNRRLPVLTGGSRDLPQRQQTMRDTIAWSYDLLNQGEQQFFRMLSMFVGGFSLEAAMAVATSSGAGRDDTVRLLASLIDSSLLERVPNPADDPRYRMLETVREYGLEQLDASGEVDATRKCHAAHFLAFAEWEAPAHGSVMEKKWLPRLESERDNIRAAIAFLCREATADECLRLSSLFGTYWRFRGPFHEGLAKLQHALAISAADPSLVRCRALFQAGQIAVLLDEYEQASALAGEHLAIARAVDDVRERALALHTLAFIEERQLHWDVARALFEEELAALKALEDSELSATVLMLLGGVSFGQGNLPRARADEREAARIYLERGELAWVALTDWYLGMFDASEGRFLDAAHQYRKSLSKWIDLHEDLWYFKSLVGLAEVAAQLGLTVTAIKLLGAADRNLEQTSSKLFPFDDFAYQRTESLCRAALEPDQIASARQEGRSLSTAEWLAEADTIADRAQQETMNLHHSTSSDVAKRGTGD